LHQGQGRGSGDGDNCRAGGDERCLELSGRRRLLANQSSIDHAELIWTEAIESGALPFCRREDGLEAGKFFRGRAGDGEE
jgi:hypothetical protein